jgi:hypothetical protein
MPNVVRSWFLKVGPVRGLKKFTVRQNFSHHTVAFLDYQFTDKVQYVMPPENTPFKVQWGVPPLAVSTHYGYVNHYETVTDENGQAFTRLVGLGTSKVMNTASPSSWSDTTRSAIVRDYAKRYKLRSVVHPHPLVVEHWTSGSRTDFRSLKVLAEEAGYRLWIDGSTLYFLDPTLSLKTPSSHPATFRKGDILSLQIFGGTNIPGETEAPGYKILHGLDYRTNEFFTATSGDPSQPTQVVSKAITTYLDALEETVASRKAADHYSLRASVRGNARVHPGSVIWVESGRVNNDQGGLWLVNEAEHVISDTDFVTNLVATRGVDMLPVARNPSTLRDMTETAPAVVRDNATWEAELQEHARG